MDSVGLLRRIGDAFRHGGPRGVALKAIQRCWFWSMNFRAPLSLVAQGDFSDFVLRPLNKQVLKRMCIAYRSELTDRKIAILRSRIGSSEIGYVVCLGDDICGYFHMTYADYYCPLLNRVHVVSSGEVHLFDDYTFSKWRRRGVHRYSVIARMQVARELGSEIAQANIWATNGPSIRVYRSCGFLPARRLLTIRRPWGSLTIVWKHQQLRRLLRLWTRMISAEAIAFVLLATGARRRALSRIDASGEIVCLYFHKPTVTQLEASVRQLLRDGFRFVTSDELYACIQSGQHPGGRLVHLSLDDGWSSNFSAVSYVVQTYDIPVTIFVSSGPVTIGYFWWSLAEYLPLNVAWLKAIDEELRQKTISDALGTAFPEREALTVQQLRDLASNPRVTIGAHTVNHVILPTCDSITARDEIVGSREELQSWIGKPVVYFAYPNGDGAIACKGKTYGIFTIVFKDDAMFLHLVRPAMPAPGVLVVGFNAFC